MFQGRFGPYVPRTCALTISKFLPGPRPRLQPARALPRGMGETQAASQTQGPVPPASPFSTLRLLYFLPGPVNPDILNFNIVALRYRSLNCMSTSCLSDFLYHEAQMGAQKKSKCLRTDASASLAHSNFDVNGTSLAAEVMTPAALIGSVVLFDVMDTRHDMEIPHCSTDIS